MKIGFAIDAKIHQEDEFSALFPREARDFSSTKSVANAAVLVVITGESR